MNRSGGNAAVRLIYKALPFFLIVILLYKGSGWAKEAFTSTKNTLLTELTEYEMGTIERQIKMDLEFKPRNLKDYTTFIKKSFPYEPDKYMKDSWDTDYRFEFDPVSKIYYLESAGPDREFGTKDDLVISNDENFVREDSGEPEEDQDEFEENLEGRKSRWSL